MEHFETERWIDFARGLVGEPERAGMDEHRGHCAACEGQAQVLGRLARTAENEAAYQPPAEVTALATSIFARHKRAALSTTRVLAKLVYDSLRDPLPAGVRTTDRPAQVLFEAENYSLDLHLNREWPHLEDPAPRMVLVGQIADRDDPDVSLAHVPVLLMNGDQVTARGESNAFGEFHLEYQPDPDLTLHIPLASGKRIEAALPKPC